MSAVKNLLSVVEMVPGINQPLKIEHSGVFWDGQERVFQLGLVTHIWNSRTWLAEAGGA